jgi:hypothetical protein
VPAAHRRCRQLRLAASGRLQCAQPKARHAKAGRGPLARRTSFGPVTDRQRPHDLIQDQGTCSPGATTTGPTCRAPDAGSATPRRFKFKSSFSRLADAPIRPSPAAQGRDPSGSQVLARTPAPSSSNCRPARRRAAVDPRTHQDAADVADHRADRSPTRARNKKLGVAQNACHRGCDASHLIAPRAQSRRPVSTMSRVRGRSSRLTCAQMCASERLDVTAISSAPGGRRATTRNWCVARSRPERSRATRAPPRRRLDVPSVRLRRRSWRRPFWPRRSPCNRCMERCCRTPRSGGASPR